MPSPSVRIPCLSYNQLGYSSGLYYKPMTIINDDSRVINKLETSLTDDARVVIYECNMFIVQATDWEGNDEITTIRLDA